MDILRLLDSVDIERGVGEDQAGEMVPIGHDVLIQEKLDQVMEHGPLFFGLLPVEPGLDAIEFGLLPLVLGLRPFAPGLYAVLVGLRLVALTLGCVAFPLLLSTFLSAFALLLSTFLIALCLLLLAFRLLLLPFGLLLIAFGALLITLLFFLLAFGTLLVTFRPFLIALSLFLVARPLPIFPGPVSVVPIHIGPHDLYQRIIMGRLIIRDPFIIDIDLGGLAGNAYFFIAVRAFIDRQNVLFRRLVLGLGQCVERRKTGDRQYSFRLHS